MPAHVDEYFLDPREVRRAFDAASVTCESSDAVIGEIRTRLLERLDVVRLQPRVVLDVGAGAGAGARALKDRYPQADIYALDLSERMLGAARRKQRLFRRFHRIVGDARALPLPDASVDLAFSNLLLEWCPDPDAVFREIRRVLRPNGLFTFTTLGPDTLQELRKAWARADSHVHVHRFIDMHDIGDALVRARFAEPVMDVERLTVTYPSVNALLQELRASGARNVAHGRRRTLTGAQRWREFEQHCRAGAREGVIPVSLEVVYGHAWIGEKGIGEIGAGDLATARAGATGEVRIPLGALKRRRDG